MRYLLDVNALIAYGLRRHSHHNQVARWIQSTKADSFLTCSITELGFIRVLGNVPSYGIDVKRAKDLLLELKAKAALPLVFIPDENDLSFLPLWVKTPLHVTDGHLAQLAIAHGAILATLDKNIPDAFLIP